MRKRRCSLNKLLELIDEKISNYKERCRNEKKYIESWKRERETRDESGVASAQKMIDGHNERISKWESEIAIWEIERRKLLDLSLPRVDVELLQEMHEVKKQINQMDIKDIQWFENGEPITIPPARVERFRLMGLNNMDFIYCDFHHNSPEQDQEKFFQGV